MTNIAIENDHYFPIKNSYFMLFSIAMLVYQRVVSIVFEDDPDISRCRFSGSKL